MASSDEDLVRAVRDGDETAFEQLIARHRERILRFLTVMIGDAMPAEDVAQDAMLSAYRNLDQLADPTRFGNWLLSIAVNRCRNWLRSEVQRAHEGETALAEVSDRSRSALSSLVRREDAARLQLAIDRLPILLREAFVLFQVEGMPYADIAGLCGATPNTLQVRVHRAKALLKQQLGRIVDTWWSG
ncbi:MAG: RNA polymerase sigma factor [Planctomycetota bacterium]